jgi:hypothetical protein
MKVRLKSWFLFTGLNPEEKSVEIPRSLNPGIETTTPYVISIYGGNGEGQF